MNSTLPRGDLFNADLRRPEAASTSTANCRASPAIWSNSSSVWTRCCCFGCLQPWVMLRWILIEIPWLVSYDSYILWTETPDVNSHWISHLRWWWRRRRRRRRRWWWWWRWQWRRCCWWPWWWSASLKLQTISFWVCTVSLLPKHCAEVASWCVCEVARKGRRCTMAVNLCASLCPFLMLFDACMISWFVWFFWASIHQFRW